MPTLYGCTYINKIGLRTLLGPAQGRFMKKTRKEAEEGLIDFLIGNSGERLVEIYGKQALNTFRVDPFDCHESGDPKGIYVKDEQTLTQVEMTDADITVAERIAKRLGYTSTAYTSTSALWGLFCLNERATQRKGCIIKTRELGFLFVQDLEDMLIAPESVGLKGE